MGCKYRLKVKKVRVHTSQNATKDYHVQQRILYAMRGAVVLERAGGEKRDTS